MSGENRNKTPWYLWPFVALWDLIAFILTLTGRLVGALLGMALMIVGLVLTVTVLGAPIGLPILIVGFLMVMRSLF